MTRERPFRILLAAGLLSVAIAVGCSSQPSPGTNAPAGPATAAAAEKGGQEETGPYDWCRTGPSRLRTPPTA
jgi:hypothetical protein